MARILIVDDNEQVRGMFQAFFQTAGYEVDVAWDGQVAVERYHAQPADLVITDIVMPIKDGVQAIMELWRDFPDVKVIAVSGSPQADNPTACLECAEIFGAMRTFTKPVNLQELLGAVEELLDPA